MSDVASLDAVGAAEVLKTAHRYFDAWNQRDAAAVAACFCEGGTYRDPTTGGALAGEAIAAYASALWAAFPDLTFELSRASCDASLVAAQWVMRGTNTGSFFALPPTGRSVEVPGADFIVVDGGAIRSVEGYFDSRAVPSQLGLDVIVQPHAIGPFASAPPSGSRRESGRSPAPSASPCSTRALTTKPSKSKTTRGRRRSRCSGCKVFSALPD
jgi:steroid delta-isomerase-like uncharacterized protein